MKMYRSVRDESVLAQVVKQVGDRVHLDVAGEDGERVITKSTFQRWWRSVEVQEETAEQAQKSKQKAPVEKVKETATPESKFVRETYKKNKFEELHNNFFDFLEKMQDLFKIEVFKTQVKGFYCLKTDNKIYLAFTLSPKNGVVLWLKTKAVEGLCDYTLVNHNFNARYTIRDWGIETYNLLVSLHDTSLEYTRNKSNSKK